MENGRWESLAETVRRERIKRGVSQSALARRTGIPQPAISRIERGHEVPSFRRLSKLLAGLGLRPRVAMEPLAPRSSEAQHLAAARRLSPGERLEQAAGWIDLVNQLRGAGQRHERRRLGP